MLNKDENKKASTQEQEEEIASEGEEEIETQEKNKMPLIVLIFLLIPAIVKDFIQLIFGFIAFILPMLAPVIIILAFIVCLPFTAFIFFITLLSGIRATWLFIGSTIDQLIPILPAATLTVILCYIFEKTPAPIKETIEKTSKITSLTTSK
ncbi:MAG: hypothetical protein PHT66_00630 [Candidatus Pacebacteria bacterium]|nr:hypothetical protein [Candidatus Paceibacterota bacterium]